MEEIRDIVSAIVKGCSIGGVQIPEVLAAFVARTIVETKASTFSLDKALTKEKRDEVIMQSIERLLERDNPALETMKMQVEYDVSFLKEDEEAQKVLRLRNKMVAAHKMAIVEVEMEDANDFESLTTLYRKIFRFLLDFPPNAKGHDRLVEREVAAALESLFPRIGLKAFLGLTREERSAQLLELARITLGIRLFNKDQGRGGAGIDAMDKESNMLAKAMAQDIDREVDFFADACAKYQTAAIRAHLEKRRVVIDNERKEEKMRSEEERKFEEKDARMGTAKAETVPLSNGEPAVSDYLIDRWGEELANRRQYLGFLRTLQDEVRSLQEKIAQLCESVQLELLNVKTLVSNKASVPKEQVYPRFDALGALWVRLYEEVTVLMARSNTFRDLCKYRLSFNPTLTESYYVEAEREPSLLDADDKAWTVSATDAAAAAAESKNASSSTSNVAFGDVASEDAAADSKEVDDFQREGGSGGGGGDKASMLDITVESGATLLSVHNTPDFMLLPLELQGYCPWTIVQARGLLIPGKPALGVVRYDNMYFVCDHALGVESFMKNPEYFLLQIRNRALHHPEYIHLLRLQRWFPSASIARLLEQNDFDPRSVGGKPATRDASTGTPTHFIESYIDINYHWNEWELRRRALKVVSLRGCATSSQQTDESHFRRDNETQVYEPRTKASQTKRDKGSNPPIVTTYVAGLRGSMNAEAKSVSTYVDNKRSYEDEEEEGSNSKIKGAGKPAARVVTLTLDL